MEVMWHREHILSEIYEISGYLLCQTISASKLWNIQMLGIENYGVFLVSGILLNITPGQDTFYILGRSISQGRRAGILSVLGIVNGALIHTLLLAFGLSVLLTKSELTFNIIKYSGAVYLCILGIKSLISKYGKFCIKQTGNYSNKKIYFQGLLTNLLNPKVALFYLAFLPQFIADGNAYGALPFLILGFTFITTGTIWCMLLAIFSSGISNRLRQNESVSKILNIMCGILFVGLGINLIRQTM